MNFRGVSEFQNFCAFLGISKEFKETSPVSGCTGVSGYCRTFQAFRGVSERLMEFLEFQRDFRGFAGLQVTFRGISRVCKAFSRRFKAFQNVSLGFKLVIHGLKGLAGHPGELQEDFMGDAEAFPDVSGFQRYLLGLHTLAYVSLRGLQKGFRGV